jgi:hypothetical protein
MAILKAGINILTRTQQKERKKWNTRKSEGERICRLLDSHLGSNKAKGAKKKKESKPPKHCFFLCVCACVCLMLSSYIYTGSPLLLQKADKLPYEEEREKNIKERAAFIGRGHRQRLRIFAAAQCFVGSEFPYRIISSLSITVPS